MSLFIEIISLFLLVKSLFIFKAFFYILNFMFSRKHQNFIYASFPTVNCRHISQNWIISFWVLFLRVDLLPPTLWLINIYMLLLHHLYVNAESSASRRNSSRDASRRYSCKMKWTPSKATLNWSMVPIRIYRATEMCLCCPVSSACKIDSIRILAPFSHIHTKTHSNNEKTPQRISIDDVEEEEDGQQWTNGSK